MTTPPTDPDPRPSDIAYRTTESEIGPPPIMKTWRRLYALVIAVLIGDVVIFYLVTKVFS
jgi:hypothetical protein